MPIKLHWSTIIFFGATFNVCVNYGYKVLGGEIPVEWMVATVFFFTSISLIIHEVSKGRAHHFILPGKSILGVLATGVGSAISAICFVTALSIGLISLVDPLWACIYSIASLALGMLVVQERPNVVAAMGIVLYLVGAALMSQG